MTAVYKIIHVQSARLQVILSDTKYLDFLETGCSHSGLGKVGMELVQLGETLLHVGMLFSCPANCQS